MSDFERNLKEYLHQLDRLNLAFTDTMQLINGIKEPSEEFLHMLARHPEYAADHERPGVLAVPKDLKFTHNAGSSVIKTALLRADIPPYADDSGKHKAYISINYAALSKLFPEIADKPWKSKRLNVEFQQHRCPSLITSFSDPSLLLKRMENIENVLVYFLATNGMKGRILHRTADGAAVMPREINSDNNGYVRDVYHRAVTYESFAAHGANDEISFGQITRTMLPHFCGLIDLYFRRDEATRRATTFAFPVLDIGKMRFENEGPDHGAHYQRVVQVQGREVVKQDSVTTGEWLRHEMAEMLAGPMREMEIIPPDFLPKFFRMVDDLRTIVTEAGPFNPHKLSPTHEAFISRLQ